MSEQLLNIQDAAFAITQGQVLAYPTEAVFGLGCDPQNQEAVENILALKGRAAKKGLILVAATLDQLSPYLSKELSAKALQQIAQVDERPTTYLVPFNPETVPAWVSGEHDLLAVRISRHPIVSQLCIQSNMPLISTSANPQGLEAARSAAQLRNYFGDRLLICEGDCGKASRPSTIKNLLSGEILRE